VNEVKKANAMTIEEICKIAEDENIAVLGIGCASKMANESPS
jgi:hypothetical protein